MNMQKITPLDFFLYFFTFSTSLGLIAELAPDHIGEQIFHYFALTITAVIVYGLLGIAVLSIIAVIFFR